MSDAEETQIGGLVSVRKVNAILLVETTHLYRNPERATGTDSDNLFYGSSK